MANSVDVPRAANTLQRSITPTQGVALYVGAIVGSGVLLLPALGATRAGPASIIAWVFDAALGIPLALTFAALAARFPSAGGVATFVAKAFGATSGAVVGWFYFIGAATAQTLVALTGAYYGASYLGLSRAATFLLAGLILVIATAANLCGIKASSRLQLGFAATVAAMLLLALLVSIPHFSSARWTPFAPHGVGQVGATAVVIFFAFFGWEAITHLAEEFRDPAKDVPRSTVISTGIITMLYVGVAVAAIGTGTYGSGKVDRTVLARLLANGIGGPAGLVTAFVAMLIALGTANAFVAATSRLGFAMARDGAFPAPLAKVSARGVPAVSVLVVGGYATLGVLVSYLANWGPETLLVVPDSLVIITFVAAMSAGVRTLTGARRVLAAAGAVLCLALVPFSGVVVVIPAVIAALALAYRYWARRRPRPVMERSDSPRAGNAKLPIRHARPIPWLRGEGDAAAAAAVLESLLSGGEGKDAGDPRGKLSGIDKRGGDGQPGRVRVGLLHQDSVRNPSPATPCENATLAAISRASVAFLLCPSMCHLGSP